MDEGYLLVDMKGEIEAFWLKRLCSLKLFTPSEFNNIHGLDFPTCKLK